LTNSSRLISPIEVDLRRSWAPFDRDRLDLASDLDGQFVRRLIWTETS
jgi:hypothetical protein